jgi:hypothetical protein
MAAFSHLSMETAITFNHYTSEAQRSNNNRPPPVDLRIYLDEKCHDRIMRHLLTLIREVGIPHETGATLTPSVGLASCG